MDNNIKEFCKIKEITMVKLSSETGMSRSHINKIANGETIPTIKNARKIAEVLESTVDEIFPEEIKN